MKMTIDDMRSVATYLVLQLKDASPRQIQLAMTGYFTEINGIPTRMGTFVLMFSDIGPLMQFDREQLRAFRG